MAGLASSESSQGAIGGETGGRRLRLVTWNVWFGEFEAGARWQALLDECLAASPDIICFQEVTAAFHTQCSEHPGIRNGGYTCAGEPRVISDYGYDVSVWVARGIQVKCSESVRLPTMLDRRALVVDALVPCPSSTRLFVRICTVHLESMKCNARRREEQLDLLLPGYRKLIRRPAASLIKKRVDKLKRHTALR